MFLSFYAAPEKPKALVAAQVVLKKILVQFNSLFKCILEYDIVFNLSLRVRSSEFPNFNKY